MAPVRRPLPAKGAAVSNSTTPAAKAKAPIVKSKPQVIAVRSDDGTLMPMANLPTVDLTDIEQRMLEEMELLNSDGTIPLQGMIYGDVGTQKTTKAMAIMQGIIPKGKKILYIDSAQGWTTLMNYPRMMRDDEGVPNVLKMDYANIETLWALADAIRAGIKSGVGPFAEIGGVIFDEYTSMHDMDLNWITDVRAAQAENEGVFKDKYTPTWPEYNAAKTRSNRLLSKFMLAKVHLIFIGHSKITKKLETVPDMPEKAGKSLYAKLHFAYLAKFNAQGNAILQTQGAKREMAKNRINGIGAITSPNEVIGRYLVWGQEDKVIQQKVEPIAEEPIPEVDEDLAAMLD